MNELSYNPKDHKKAFEYFLLSESLLQGARPVENDPEHVDVDAETLAALLSLAENDAFEMPALLKPQAPLGVKTP